MKCKYCGNRITLLDFDRMCNFCSAITIELGHHKGQGERMAISLTFWLKQNEKEFRNIGN